MNVYVLPPWYLFFGTPNNWMFQKPNQSLAHVYAAKEHGGLVYNCDFSKDTVLRSQYEMYNDWQKAKYRVQDSSDDVYQAAVDGICQLPSPKVFMFVQEKTKVSAAILTRELQERGISVTAWGPVPMLWLSGSLWLRNSFDHVLSGEVDSFPPPPGYFLTPDLFAHPMSPWDFSAIEGQRGCPYSKCKFCNRGHLRKAGVAYRCREEEDVVAEMLFRYKSYGTKMFYLLDDCAPNPIKIKQARDKLGVPAEVTWMAEARVTQVQDSATAQAFFDAGCRRLKFGVEVFDDAALKVLGKGVTEVQCDKAVHLAREVGIEVSVYILLLKAYGITEKTYEKTLRWLDEVSPDYVTTSVCIPYPGTEIFDDFCSSKRPLPSDLLVLADHRSADVARWWGLDDKLVRTFFNYGKKEKSAYARRHKE